MRSTYLVLLGTLLALCCGSAAAANGYDGNPKLDPAVFRALTQMQLDSAIEEFAMLRSQSTAYALMGPSSMNCQRTAVGDYAETCVVTAVGPVAAMPAAVSLH